jgi:DNA-binding MarR family transcriptional regulator
MQLPRRLLDALASLAHSTGLRSTPIGKNREDELMLAILDFGRMKSSFYGTDNTMVDTTEMAFRLRETSSSIKNALTSLEQNGLAEHTDTPQLWILKVANEDGIGAVSIVPQS